MRIIQAPRKRSTSSEKSEAKRSKSADKNGFSTRPVNKNSAQMTVSQLREGTRSLFEDDVESSPLSKKSHSDGDSVRSSFESGDKTDDPSRLEFRSNTKSGSSNTGRGRAKKDVDIIHKSIELLARREHSVDELKHKLKMCEYSDRDIDEALAKLLRDGLVCDERFTEAYVRHRSLRGFGPSKIAMELNSRGVSGVLIEEYVDSSSPQWLDLALDVYQKKFGVRAPTTYTEWTKRARFLQGRGFSASIIQNVCPSIEFE